MDLLTHIFLPLVALYVLKREAFNPPYHFLFHSFSFSFLNDPVRVIYAVPKMSFTYELLSGFGVASLILFVMVYLGRRER
jgi:hypothetical protein